VTGSDVAALVERHLDHPTSTWSVGVPGAIAEFARSPGEDVVRGRGTARTARGAIRLQLPPATRAVAYETPVGPHEHWNHAVALCLPNTDARRAIRTVLTELGPDTAAVDPADRDAILFDLGLGTATVDACVRTAEPDLVRDLRGGCGRPLLGDAVTVARLVAAGPHRVFTTACGRIEVRTPIPPPQGRSPDGPHTHLLPHLLRPGRTHAVTVPVPPGHLPCAHLYPPHPLAEPDGSRRPFDTARAAAFEQLLAHYGDATQRRLCDTVIRAVRARAGPAQRPRPTDAAGRAAVEVALRKLAHTDGPSPLLSAWRDRLGDDTTGLLDHDGDRNAG
jgi:hypothetical protein